MPDPVTLAVGVGWGISIIGWLISPNMTKLVNKGWSYLGDVTSSSANNLQNLEEKVQHLKLMFEVAQASPDAAEKSERWVKKLKSAFYDAEDILDEIDYHRLKWKATTHHRSVNTTNEKATAKENFRFPLGSKDKLRKSLKEIEKLIDEGQTLLPLVRSTTSGDNITSSPQQTTGLGSHSKTTSKPPKVYGRDEDAKKIISMLHDTAADHFAILIHGFAGTGKTTLAQYVCEYVKKKNSGVPYFELIMWIHVTKNFSVHTVYKEMLEIASGQEKTADVNFSNLDMLQSELEKKLKDRRLLLVLDDVWYSERVTEQEDVKKLLSPFMEADKGSRVLLTSRTADAAKLLDGAYHIMPISDMNEDDFFKMFMHYALDNSSVTDQAPRSKFETVGKDIAALLQRSPLAARTVAGQLRRKPLRFWIDNSIQKEKHHLLKDTMGALWWSYHQLEEPVRQCFAYCSMFPRRHKLDRDELIKMWMAQGFGDTNKTPNIESAADECFEVLLSTSFIQLKPNTAAADDDDQEYYIIHDLLHDLAGIVAGSDSFTIEKDMVDHQIPENVRHLFIDTHNLGELIEQIVELDTLRTLVISGYTEEMTGERFESILRNLKKLRFLSVQLMEFGGNVPECIGELKHLRYLALDDLSRSRRIDMPPTFTKLYHLQELHTAVSVRFLDSNHMADLENLRRISGAPLSIPNIGRMPWLQNVSVFTVKKEKGYEITQLEKLNNIRGELYIRGLGNIKSEKDARRANLSKKKQVSNLSLDWKSYEETGSSSTKKQKTTKPEEILEALHPPALLEELDIENYEGSTFPSWLSTEDSKLEHLERLKFFNCHGSDSLFKFSKHLPKLQKIWISTCSWNTLPDNIDQLASLEKLIIHRSRNIQSLPGLPSSLKILEITVCGNIKTLPELLPSLEELQIEHCPNIQSPPGLPSSLKKLHIKGCPNIKTLPGLPPSLEELQCDQYLVDSYPDRQAIARLIV